MEASTGIEPVYTDLQSAASPLRQLAIRGVACAMYCVGCGGGLEVSVGSVQRNLSILLTEAQRI